MARRFGAGLSLAVMCVAALTLGWRTTRGLRWPGDPDLFRDIAQAQTIADGGFFEDPAYADKALWYPPLVPLIVAVISPLTAPDIPAAYARMGTFLNLAAPIGFFALACRWLGAGAGLVATFHFVFLRRPEVPDWGAASYSPWLLAPNFVQALLYLALLAHERSARTGSLAWTLAAGVLAGLVALGHVAPAAILGGAMLADVLASGGGDALRTSVRRKAGIIVVAAAVASPFLYAHVWTHGMRVRNPEPLAWTWVALRDGPALLAVARQLGLDTLVACVGLALVATRPAQRRFVLGWAAASAGWLAYGVLVPAAEARGIPLPRLAPLHHFLFAWKAVESALWGAALWSAAGLLVGRLPRRAGSPRSTSVGWWLAPLATALAVALVWPPYERRRCFVADQARARAQGAWTDRAAAVDWIRAHTGRGTVFLAADDLALEVVLPAGRKTVALDPVFASPYVLPEPRRAARDAALRRLERGEAPRIGLRAEYVVTRPLGLPASDAWLPVWSSPSLVIGRLVTAPENGKGPGR